MTTRADDNGPFKEFTLGGWMREGLDGMCGQVYGRRVCSDMSRFESHMRNSAKEQLLAVRSLIDGFIERIDEAEAEADQTEAQSNQA
jgi:hypothetical protein